MIILFIEEKDDLMNDNTPNTFQEENYIAWALSFIIY